LLICNFTVEVSERAILEIYSWFIEDNKSEYQSSGRSSRITFDDSGVPIVDYGHLNGIYVGKQRNPVTISQYALKYHDSYENGNESCRQLFTNCVDWIVDNAEVVNDYMVLEYKFPYPRYNLTAPWRSAMAHGQAIQALIRAHSMTNDDAYFDVAQGLLNSLFVEVEDGGVTYKTSTDGWWYEEWADEGGFESRVLNGMIITLRGVREFYLYTNDSNAKYLFDQGIIALKLSVPDYDRYDAFSYYDVLGKEAGKYHQLHIELLDELYEMTDEAIFLEYHDRWQSYYNEPPFIYELVTAPTKMGGAIFIANLFVIFAMFEIMVVIFRKIKNKDNKINSIK
jgi:hypothetical protein